MTVSVVIPALNEQDTVADVVRACLASRADEVIVIDSASTDETAKRATQAGAKVVDWQEVCPQILPRAGKGEALWRGIKAASGDVVVFIDADVTSLSPEWVDALAAPCASPDIHLVKASYQRGFADAPSGGGRVTELTAKPLLRELFPQLAQIKQPLAGEYAIRRDVALALPFVAGYGVEVGLLIDIFETFGSNAIAQVELGVRRHRNRPLDELLPMADIVTRTILSRARVTNACATGPDDNYAHAWPVQVEQRPPWREIRI